MTCQNWHEFKTILSCQAEIDLSMIFVLEFNVIPTCQGDIVLSSCQFLEYKEPFFAVYAMPNVTYLPYIPYGLSPI